jgi:hypothetical protein
MLTIFSFVEQEDDEHFEDENQPEENLPSTPTEHEQS